MNDGAGTLWLSTEGGLLRFNPSTGEISRYGTAEGVPIAPSENLHASFQDQQGYLYLGGTNGFVRFHPARLRDNTRVPPIFITSFKIFGEEHPLDSAVTSKKVIDLSYRENVISFEFAALNYTRPEKTSTPTGWRDLTWTGFALAPGAR